MPISYMKSGSCWRKPRDEVECLSKSRRRKTPPAHFDKYQYYLDSVQSPEKDVEFLRDTFKMLAGWTPKILREDFCGTFANCCEWVKLGPAYQAIGVDLDDEPLEYGRKNYLPKLKPAQKERLAIHQQDVLGEDLPKADLIVALNFSFFIFKERQVLRRYFKEVHDSLHNKGLFIADCFGGSACQEANEERTDHGKFSYYWDQVNFDPVTNKALFHIHYKRKGEKKRERVFTYDWRMWTIPEIREIMHEAGFSKTWVLWEGTTKKGEGDGDFKPVEKGEECDSWIAYIVGAK